MILEERGLGDVRRGKRRRETKEDLERGEGLMGFEGVEDNASGAYSLPHLKLQ